MTKEVSKTTLKAILFDNLPKHHKEWLGETILDVPRVAEEISIKPQNVYLWINSNGLPPRRMKQLIDLPGSTLTIELLQEFANFE